MQQSDGVAYFKLFDGIVPIFIVAAAHRGEQTDFVIMMQRLSSCTRKFRKITHGKKPMVNNQETPQSCFNYK